MLAVAVTHEICVALGSCEATNYGLSEPVAVPMDNRGLWVCILYLVCGVECQTVVDHDRLADSFDLVTDDHRGVE